MVEVHVLVIVRFQVGHRGQLAPRLGHPGDDKVAENLVWYLVETYPVIDLIQEQLRSVQKHCVHVVNHTGGLFTLASALIIEV